jgi:hypothetical protein
MRASLSSEGWVNPHLFVSIDEQDYDATDETGVNELEPAPVHDDTTPAPVLGVIITHTSTSWPDGNKPTPDPSETAVDASQTMPAPSETATGALGLRDAPCNKTILWNGCDSETMITGKCIFCTFELSLPFLSFFLFVAIMQIQ